MSSVVFSEHFKKQQKTKDWPPLYLQERNTTKEGIPKNSDEAR